MFYIDFKYCTDPARPTYGDHAVLSIRIAKQFLSRTDQPTQMLKLFKIGNSYKILDAPTVHVLSN